ncbi:hypothetical protein [Pseudomonas sp. 10-1B]|uniref:hypothetical protein n=1 Tax=Pseudomonas sp. 10-1B TaxID=1546029 RepID=UPI00128BE0A3|nr:hypothetical protein [Pseudomonas sp. 10-1B]
MVERMNAPFFKQMNNFRHGFLPRHGRAQPMTVKPRHCLTLTEIFLPGNVNTLAHISTKVNYRRRWNTGCGQ